MSIHAYDFVTGNPSEKVKQRCKLCVKTSNKYDEKNGLLRTLNAAVGLVYTISVNIKTDDGLINGATCILKKIHFYKQIITIFLVFCRLDLMMKPLVNSGDIDILICTQKMCIKVGHQFLQLTESFQLQMLK